MYRTAEGDIYYSREIVDPDKEASEVEDETIYHVVVNWFEELKQIAPKKKLFALPRIGFSSTGALDGVGAELLGALQDKALWSRFGL